MRCANAIWKAWKPADYHARSLDSLLHLFQKKLFWHKRGDPATSADLDLLLTDAYLKLFPATCCTAACGPKMPQDIWHVSLEHLDLSRLSRPGPAGKGAICGPACKR